MATPALLPLALLLPLLLLLAPAGTKAQDQGELQLYDLVEEVNANFYERLGTTRSATLAEVRRAFRKISLLYHPDRLNKHDEETVNYFRQLNAIHEVLKDEQLRLKYDDILDNGLPTWRSRKYWGRKWHKLSLVETVLVFAITFTIGHYLVLWGIYVERKLEIDDLFRRKSRKKQKQLEEELEPLKGPGWRDILPLVIARAIFAGIVGTPGAFRAMRDHMADQRQAERDRKLAAAAKAEAEAEEAQRREERKKQKRERGEQRLIEMKQQLLVEQQQLLSAAQLQQASTAFLETGSDSAGSAGSAGAGPLIEGPWSEAEQQLLVRAVARFPGGTPGRWEKIAGLLRRSVADVTARAREMDAQTQRQAAAAMAAAFEVSADGEISDESGDDSDSSTDAGRARHRRAKRNRRRQQQQPTGNHAAVAQASEASAPAKGGPASKVWSQAEQSLLETALRQFPKGVRERWERVAEHVGTRSPEECAQRCKAISEKLRLKKE